MNMMKKNGGFTLVELIVVIAILAILAGVAVPAYSGYINKAKEATDYTMLDSVKTAVFFEALEKDPGHDGTVKTITVGNTATNAKTVAVTGDTDLGVTSVDISAYVGGDKITFSSGATGAEWTAASGEWKLTK